jgi:hypothetical protein
MRSGIRRWLPERPVNVPRHLEGALVFAFALALRLPLLANVRHPGHADPAYYLALATNLAAGRGFVIDYVWHFLTPDVSLTHYANDYWMPGPSMAMAMAMWVLGNTTKAAVLSCVVVSAITAALATVVASKQVGRIGGAITGLVVAALPQTVAWSLQADSVALAAAAIFAAYAIALNHGGRQAPVLAGVALGVAVCCRQDAVLAVLPVLLLLLAPPNTESRWRRALRLAMGAAMPLAVLATVNQLSGGHLLPRSGRALLAVDYEDIYRIGGPDPTSFLGLPVGERLHRLANAAWAHCVGWSAETRHWGWPGLLLLALQSRRSRLCAVTLLHFGSLLAFYSVFSAVGLAGGFMRGTAAIVPVVVLGAVGLLQRLGAFGPLLATLGTVWLAVAATNRGRSIVERNNRLGDEAGAVAGLIVRSSASAVAMTRSPWQLALHGVRTVQIPNGDEEAIIRMACRYRVTHFVMPAPSVRPALEELVRRRSWSAVGSSGSSVVYVPCSRGASCGPPNDCDRRKFAESPR